MSNEQAVPVRRPRSAPLALLVPVAWILVAPALVLAQGAAPAPPTAALHGHVLHRGTDTPVREAELRLDGDSAATRTDSTGAFRVTGLAPGAHTVVVRAIGFVALSFTAELTAGRDTEYAIHLDLADSTAQPLAPVAVTANAPPPVSYRMVDFERRRKTGRGQYLSSEEIERSGASTLQDLARGMRGVTTHCGGGGGCRLQMVRAPNGCQPEYVVDGRTDNMFGALTPIRDIVGLEVYTGPSDVPGEFAGRNAGCGVVVIWTRAGPPPARAKKKQPVEEKKEPGR